MVRVLSVVMCERQGLDHGYHPWVKGRIGVITLSAPHVPPPPGHPWRVEFTGGPNELQERPIPNRQYFAATELELVEGAS